MGGLALTPESALCYSPRNPPLDFARRRRRRALSLLVPPNVIEEQTVRLLDFLLPTISLLSPPAFLGILIGLICGSAFYLIFGRGLGLFLPYLVLAVAGALVGVAVGTQIPEVGPMLGEVSVVAALASSWSFLFIARSMRL